MISKLRRSENVSDGSKIEDLNFPPVKFIAFPLIIGQDVEEIMSENKNKSTKLCQVFRINGIAVNVKIGNKITKKVFKLSEEALSASLEYSYKKATQ